MAAATSPRVERVRPLLRDPPQRAREIGEPVALARGRAPATVPAPPGPTCRRCAPCTRAPSRATSAAGPTARVETEPPEARCEIGPEPHRAGHRHGARPVVLRGPVAELGRRPARAVDARGATPPSQTSANASPPTPLSVGSATVSIAAAASAASTAFPPRSSARRPARRRERMARRHHRVGRDRRHPPPAARARARPGWNRASRSMLHGASIARDGL